MTRTGLVLIAAVALTSASCDDTLQSLVAVRELQAVRHEVTRVSGVDDVLVNCRKDHVIAITVGGKAGAGRQDLFQRIAAAAYLAYPSRADVDAVIVQGTDGTASRRFRPYELVEPAGLTEHWVNPHENADQLYFIGLGHVRLDLVNELAIHFRQTLGLDIETLPALAFDPATVDETRSQTVAEELVAAIGGRYPALARDEHVRIIGVTGDDMFLRSERWAFGLSLRSEDDRIAVVSYARMDPAAFHLSPDPDMLRSRLTKMVAKDIGVLYYGLPLSDNPRSALYADVGGTDELDVMTEYFDPRPAATASRTP